jgi:hypothetical protein
VDKAMQGPTLSSGVRKIERVLQPTGSIRFDLLCEKKTTKRPNHPPSSTFFSKMGLARTVPSTVPSLAITGERIIDNSNEPNRPERSYDVQH